MKRLEYKINKEKKILDELVSKSDNNLSSELILEQSQKVDKLIVIYQKIKQNPIKLPNDYLEFKAAESNV